MDFHTIASMFPNLEGSEFDELVHDIKVNGLREPIVTFEGRIIDGKNRYNACIEAGVEPKYREFNPEEEGDMVDFVVSENIRRRHLTASQRAMLAAQAVVIKQQLRDAAYERKISMLKQFGSTDVALMPHRSEVFGMGKKSRDLLGQTFGVGGRYTEYADKVLKEAPELVPSVAKGKMTLTKALKELDKRKETLKAREVEVPEEVYDVIVVDLLDKTTYNFIEELGTKINGLSKESTMVFFWCPPANLSDIMNIVNFVWKYTYRTCMVWDKVIPTQGKYFQNRHELLLVYSKGAPVYPEDKSLESIQAIEATDEGRPKEFLRLIQQLYPNSAIIRIDDTIGSSVEPEKDYEPPTNWNIDGNDNDYNYDPEIKEILDKYAEL